MHHYLLLTEGAHHGFEKRYTLLQFSTAKHAEAYAERFNADKRLWGELLDRDCPMPSGLLATGWDSIEQIPATLVAKLVKAARAKYPDMGDYIGQRVDHAPFMYYPISTVYLY